MKFLVLIFAMAAGSAFAEPIVKRDVKPTFKATCNLSDIESQVDGGNIQTETYTFELGKNIDITVYNGHKYQATVFDVSYNGKTRYEFNIAARDAKTNAVIGSVSATFSEEVPDVLYQDGPNILLNCMQ